MGPPKREMLCKRCVRARVLDRRFALVGLAAGKIFFFFSSFFFFPRPVSLIGRRLVSLVCVCLCLFVHVCDFSGPRPMSLIGRGRLCP